MDCKKDKGCNDRKKQRVYVNNIYVDGDCCDELCEQVVVNTDDIAGLKEKVTVNEQNIMDNAGNIQKNSADIANLESRLSKNEEDIEALQGRADVTDARVSVAEDRIVLNEGNITNLTSKSTAIENNMAGLTERVDNNETSISLIQNGLEETNTNVAELGGKVNDHQGSIDALNVRVDHAEDNIKERYTKTEVNSLLANKAEKSLAMPSDDGLMSKEDKIKIDGIAPGAEVNQNAFSFVDADGIVLSADQEQDVVAITGGKNISVIGDAATKKVSIGLSGSVEADTLDGLHLSDIQRDYNAQLDNKVDGKWTFYKEISELVTVNKTETVEGIIESMAEHSILIASVNTQLNNNPSEFPTQFGTICIQKIGNLRVSLNYYDKNSSTEYIGVYCSDTLPKFKGWKQLATAEPPTKYYNLVPVNGLQEGSINPSRYIKNQFNEVLLQVSFVKPANITLQNNTQIATLPVGFRPSKTYSFAGVYAQNIPSVIATPALFTVEATGMIKMWGCTVAATSEGAIYFTTTFLSEN